MALLTGLAIVLMLATPAAPAAAEPGDDCPNAELRTGFSASLPDCRAYERVSPPGSRPYLSSAETANGMQAAISGDRISWFTYYPLPGAPSRGFQYLSTRGPSGWSTRAAIPPYGSESSVNVNCAPSIYFSSDLRLGVLSAGFSESDDECGDLQPPLIPGAPEHTRNLYLWDPDADTYELIRVTADGAPPSGAELGDPPGNAQFQAASSDFTKIVFGDAARLTPGAPSPIGLYLWNRSDATIRLVSVLPDGTPVDGRIANAAKATGPGFGGGEPGVFTGPAPFTGAVSSDGSRVFFQANGNLYLRENADRPQSPVENGACTDPEGACTVQLDAAQGSGSGGGGTFAWASSDGSLAYFTAPASSGLTPETEPGSGENLYRYNTNTGQLTNLTAGADARVQGVSGVSKDGAYAYFVAEGALAPGATAGQPNLYVFHGGVLTFIATLDPGDSLSWNLDFLRARISPNGRYFAFQSQRSLAGYDTFDTTQIYLYDAVSDQLRCASCDPDGAPPVASSVLGGTISIANGQGAGYMQRSLLDNGRFYFNSRNPLVPGASNGKTNVYQLEPAGVGSCDEPDGCLSLISSGTGNDGSFIYDASASGDDVFFITSQDLLGDGGETTLTLYDARAGGGFPVENPPVPCSGDECKEGPSGRPADHELGSSGASAGNVAQRSAKPRRCARLVSKAKRAARRSVHLKRKARRTTTKKRVRQLRAKAKRQRRKSKRLENRAASCRRGSR